MRRGISAFWNGAKVQSEGFFHALHSRDFDFSSFSLLSDYFDILINCRVGLATHAMFNSRISPGVSPLQCLSDKRNNKQMPKVWLMGKHTKLKLINPSRLAKQQIKSSILCITLSDFGFIQQSFLLTTVTSHVQIFVLEIQLNQSRRALDLGFRDMASRQGMGWAFCKGRSLPT